MTMSQETQIADLPLGSKVQFLSADSHGLIALEKPPGLLSHPNRRGDHARSLLTADYDYNSEVYTWTKANKVHHAWLLNRIDSPTSGIVLLALNEIMVPVVRQLFASHKVSKTYYAVVKHAPSPESGCWKDVLKQDAYRSTKMAQSEPGGFAQTYYQVVNQSRENLPLSLIKLMPVTGRTHQLRIQCNYHRHPIVGDQTHGDFKLNRKITSITGEKRLMLHSAEVVLDYKFRGKSYCFNAKSELPDAFTQLVQVKRPR